MRTLDRNKRIIYVAQKKSETEILDADGNATGEFKQTYSAPVKKSMHVYFSATAIMAAFGKDCKYSAIIQTEEDCFKEDSVLWINNKPIESYDYVVSEIRPSLNHYTIGIKKVTK